MLAALSTLLVGPSQAGSPWLKCSFNEPTATNPGNTVNWFMMSQEAKKSVEFINSSKEKFTLSALYTPSQIVFIYPKLVSRDISYEVEFRLNRKTLAISKQVSNELDTSSGSCVFTSAP
ncbi:hypothetical protein [Cyanobium sp. ATX 6F1]|uniref:hypothetical protein n=1 Tax=unclassified Cyanobium TaxID=2627006 RepID=UPI0020CFB3B9|nr:hypothetical protein [Cyanobium sp. ATX 6F1]MCP9915648.1 hypothetical protein [Cyanobium sp. ATX 6F1]